MTVRLIDEAVIALENDCPVEDAEPLLQLLLAYPDALIDWGGCDDAHTAIVQLLMAAPARLRGPPGGAALAAFVDSAIMRART